MNPLNHKSILNIAILAHADAGKTTITEQFLYLSGQTRQPGNVDQGTTQTDFLPVEKERGISVCSSHISFLWGNTRVNLIDTPGHVDFSSDVERILRVIDAAILVISAVEGVQAHTETLWTALSKRRIPVLIFVNKIDRVGADSRLTLQAIENELKIKPFQLQETTNEGENNYQINNLWSANYQKDTLAERVIESNESLLENFLCGIQPNFKELEKQLISQIKNCSLYLLMFGSAKSGVGIKEMLNNVVDYFQVAEADTTKPLSALIYGIGHDKTFGKISYVRVFSGSISSRDVLKNVTQCTEEKVTQVRRILAGKSDEIGSVFAGDIAGLCGLQNSKVGDILGTANGNIPIPVRLKTPLIAAQIKASNAKDYPALAAALQELAEEDPSLEFEWLREEAELQVKIMGWIQMEIIERILADRFGISAKVENPIVIYKETPSTISEGYVRYWMPKPCWAIMKFRIEPGERNSGIKYSSIVPVNNVQLKYQNEVERSIASALKQGIKGWEVTDIKITFIDGEDHNIHTRPGDFAIATPMGIMDGLVNSGTTLLEPMSQFKINAPEELLGAVVSDITQMRGEFNPPTINDGKFILTGKVPVSTSIDFPVKLSSRSGGKAHISLHFEGYRECNDEQGIIRPFKGISPLDTAKYILKARKAIQ